MYVYDDITIGGVRIEAAAILMMGRPPGVRGLAKPPMRALTVMELQSVGARRPRITNCALQDYNAPAKDKREPSTKAARRHHNTMSTPYICGVSRGIQDCNEPQGWGTRASETASQYNSKNSATEWPTEMQQYQRVPGTRASKTNSQCDRKNSAPG